MIYEKSVSYNRKWPITLYSEGRHESFYRNELRGFRYGVGAVVVERAKATLAPQQMNVALLASLGLKDNVIAEELRLTENTVDTHLKKVFRKLDIKRREGMPRKLFTLGAYTLRSAGTALELFPAEQQDLQEVSLGVTRDTAARRLDKAPNTLKRQLHDIRVKNKLDDNTGIIMAGILSGQIVVETPDDEPPVEGFSAGHQPELTQPVQPTLPPDHA